MGVDREIFSAELPAYPDVLFDPTTLGEPRLHPPKPFTARLPELYPLTLHPSTLLSVFTVIGQENELFLDRKVPAFVARNVFAFHHKGGTLTSYLGREDIQASPGSYSVLLTTHCAMQL
jgi:hypothetical protein